MAILGGILFAIGLVIGLAGDVRFMVLTYRHGLGWFFTCLFLPLVSWIFFAFHFKEAWRPCIASIGGFLLAGIGYALGGFDFLS